MMAGDQADQGARITRSRRRALWLALGFNAAYMLVELAGGLRFNSLALLADAAHMFSDVAGLSIALIAIALLSRPPSSRHTFGLLRAEVLGAQANGVLLLVTAGWIMLEAWRRIGSPHDVDGGGLLLVASVGLLVNLGSAVILGRSRGESLNMRGAYLHMLADAAGSVGAIAAGLAVLWWNANWVDPAISVLIALLVVWAAARLFLDTLGVLLEATPRGVSAATVEAAITEFSTVEAVHHLHLWNLASDVRALSAHVVIEGEPDLHHAQMRGDEIKVMLSARFNIGHATLELECHRCGVDGDQLIQI
jgi:cobalt-zinc-cadmium efflux system protein